MQHKKALQERWTAPRAPAHEAARRGAAPRRFASSASPRSARASRRRRAPARGRGAPGDRGGRGRAGAAGLEGREPARPGKRGRASRRRRPLSSAGAPQLEQTEDLRQPYILLLVAARRAVPRSVAAAMHTLVDALQKPLSRTDQMLLEIAFRRCIRAASPEGEREVERWEACSHPRGREGVRRGVPLVRPLPRQRLNERTGAPCASSSSGFTPTRATPSSWRRTGTSSWRALPSRPVSGRGATACWRVATSWREGRGWA